VPITVESELVRRVPFIWELRKIPFTHQEQILFYVLERLPHLGGVKVDATGLGAQLAENTRLQFGECVDEVKLSVAWYGLHCPQTKARLQDGGLFLPDDADVMADLRTITVIDGTPRVRPLKNQGTDGKYRHADSAVAIFLADAAANDDVVEYGYESVRPTTAKGDRLARPVERTRQWGAGGIFG